MSSSGWNTTSGILSSSLVRTTNQSIQLSGELHIQGLFNQVGLIVQGAASQSSDLQQWQNSSSGVLAKIDASGNLTANGVITATGSGVGSVDLRPGDSTHSGYIEFFPVSGSRLGYIGYESAAGSIIYRVENGSGSHYFITSGAAAVPVVVQGQASQTGDLQQWQNTAGTVLSRIDASGNLSSYGGYFGTAIGGPFATVQIGATGPGTQGLIVQGATSQTADLTEWRNGSSAVVAKVLPAGDIWTSASIVAGTVSWSGTATQMGVLNTNANDRGLVVQSASGQAVNIQEWQANTGSVLAAVDKNGALLSVNGIYSGNILSSYGGVGNAFLGIVITSSSNRGIIVQGAASQAVNLQEWQANGAAILAKVDATGNITAPTLSASGLTGATAASRYAGATTSGAPTTGTFAVGDTIVDQTGFIWICTVAGSPGTWTKVGAGMTLISSQTVGATATKTITFSSIPQTFTNLHLIARCRSNNAGTNDIMSLQVNGDSTAVYDAQWWLNNAGTVSAYKISGGTNWNDDIGTLAAGTSTAGNFTQMSMDLDLYTNTNMTKTVKWHSSFIDGLSNTYLSMTLDGNYRTQTAITSLSIGAANGSFVQYSTFNLYGVI